MKILSFFKGRDGRAIARLSSGKVVLPRRGSPTPKVGEKWLCSLSSRERYVLASPLRKIEGENWLDFPETTREVVVGKYSAKERFSLARKVVKVDEWSISFHGTGRKVEKVLEPGLVLERDVPSTVSLKELSWKISETLGVSYPVAVFRRRAGEISEDFRIADPEFIPRDVSRDEWDKAREHLALPQKKVWEPKLPKREVMLF